MKTKESKDKVGSIPEPTLRRLPWYLSFVKLLQTEGHRYVSSPRIASGVGVDAALVAKDLSYVKLQGRTRVGYETTALIEYLEEFLGFTQRHRAFLIGVGSLGSGLLADKGLNQFGLEVRAGFDVAQELIGTEVAGVPVHHIDELASRIQAEEIKIAILTVPILQAQLMTDRLVRAGIKAIWNFTPFRIQAPADVVVQNTSMYAHLALMFTRMKAASERQGQGEA
ncbi:redox-sensing transcriptional repressor Rex [Porphyromonas sp.]